MLTALEFINVEQLHNKNSALLPFHLFNAICDHILNGIGIKHRFDRAKLLYQVALFG